MPETLPPPAPQYAEQDASASLLSLSIAAASAAPIPVPATSSASSGKHQRLGSMGKARRRLSDARDAASRPSSFQLSMANLSLSSSTSPPPQQTSEPIPIKGNGKKRGVDHKCEFCSKIYRHPSCLIKHRWEHTPHWRESSKYVLSKHQQVQLLEAAAILSHLSPSASSLPEDRSLWPSFLSGGSLPPPSTSEGSTTGFAQSVPVARATSTGPRLHDYSLPTANNVTQVGPGLVGVSTSSPIAVPTGGDYNGYRGASAESWNSSSYAHSSSFNSAVSLPRSSVRSRSRSGSRSDDEDSDVEVELEEEEASSNRGRKTDNVKQESEWEEEMEMEMD